MCWAHYMRTLRGTDLDRPIAYYPSGVRTLSPENRFWAKVEKTDGCWMWTGTRWGQKGKYGQFTVGGRPMQAHRYAYELSTGPIADGLEIDHLCHVTLCVNPAHLEAVTPAENQRRRLPHSETAKIRRETYAKKRAHP